MLATWSLSKTIARAHTATVVAIGATIVSTPRMMATAPRTCHRRCSAGRRSDRVRVERGFEVVTAIGLAVHVLDVALDVGDAPSPLLR